MARRGNWQFCEGSAPTATRPEHYCNRNRCIRPIAGPRERSSTHIHQVRLFEPLPIAFELLPTVEKRVEAGVKLMEELSHAFEEPVSKEKDRDSRWKTAHVDRAVLGIQVPPGRVTFLIDVTFGFSLESLLRSRSRPRDDSSPDFLEGMKSAPDIREH